MEIKHIGINRAADRVAIELTESGVTNCFVMTEMLRHSGFSTLATGWVD